MDENTFVHDDYDYTYDDHDYYDDYEDQAEEDEPKLAMAGYRKRSMSKDSSTAMRMGREVKDDNRKNSKKDVDKDKLELNNSKLYSSVESYELRKHIMDLIKIYREKVDNLHAEYDDYDAYGDFYSFENYYDLDKDDQKSEEGKESEPRTVYFDYIDIGDNLTYKKKWNGSK